MASGYIDDFGQKIGGAKKDLWRSRGLQISDLNDIDLKEYLDFITKDNIWPVPNYVEYLEKCMEPVCIYFMKNIRDKVQAKTEVYRDDKNRERAEKYIQFLHDIKDSCEQIKTKADIKKFRDILILGHGYKDSNNNWTPKAEGTPGLENTFLKYIRFNDSDILDLEYETAIQNFPYEFRGDLKGATIVKSYFDGNYHLVKGNKYLVKDKSFKSTEDAIKYARTELLDILDGKKKTRETKTVKVVRPQLEHIQRTGPDIRKGHDANTDHLLQAFKFRGGEFGNWNNQEDRQAYINYAFDALVDLGYVLDAPLEFISFSPKGSYGGQMLAIAFGARGSGNALAHYECGRVVINLTKMRGAGCLAHEWGHAFDDFLGIQCGMEGLRTFLSGRGYRSVKQHNDIAEAFTLVMNTMKQKERPAEEILAMLNKDLDKYLNRVLKSWIESDLKYFDKELGNRRAATTGEVARMEKLKTKLYETGDREYYDELADLYKSVKGVMLSKETRDHADSILNHVKYIKEAIRKYSETGKFEHKYTDDTNFYRAAQELDKYRKEPYYTAAWELFARCFESYVEDKLGFKSQYLVHSTKNNALYGDLKPYPEGEERENINKAMENLIKLAIEKFADTNKKFNYSIYKNNQDNKDKYSQQETFVDTPKRQEVQPEVQGKKIESALVELYLGYEAEVKDDDVDKVISNVDKILSTIGQSYFLSKGVKYKQVNTGQSTFTCVIYDGVLLLKPAKSHIELESELKDKIKSIAKASDSVVRLITPELEGIVKYLPNDLSKYMQALAKIVNQKQTLDNQSEVKQAQSIDSMIDNIASTKDLRDVLVNIAESITKVSVYPKYHGIYTGIKSLVPTKLQLGNVVEGDVPNKFAQGNSKSWMTSQGVLVISDKATIEKKLEGLIEPIVKVLTMRQYKSPAESAMISSAVTYMICKRFGLDVRTYCITEEYERLIRNKQQVKAFVNICMNMYQNIAKELEL